MNTLTIKGVTLGEDNPKIAVSIIGKTKEDIQKEIDIIQRKPIDIVEWRVDYYEDVEDSDLLVEVSKNIYEQIKQPLLVSFRTKEEGGEKEISSNQYYALYHAILKSTYYDMIDVEVDRDHDVVTKLVKEAHAMNKYVVMSHHNFNKTPSNETLKKCFMKMDQLNGDVLKIAAMPNDNQDVERLKPLSKEIKQSIAKPMVMISMGVLGRKTRVNADEFQSCLTFAALEEGSAPGQMSVEELFHGKNYG